MMSTINTSDLKKFAREIGFDDVGIASALDGVPFSREARQAGEEGRFGPLDYLERTLSTRVDLLSAFPGARSVVVLVKNYYTGDHPSLNQKRAKIARYAWGKDYHHWFKKKLRILRSFLSKQSNGTANVWIFNDTGPFLERAWAFKAGLGFIGKSSMFIHRGFGTWTLLGGLATDLELACDQEYSGPDCGSCNKCMSACPTSAITSPFKVDAAKCISTWTIERPLHADAEKHAPRNHDWVFGCDICQEVCPWNKFEVRTLEERFTPIPGRIFLEERTFLQDLRGSPLHRAGKPGLRANFLRIQKTLSIKNKRISSLLNLD